MPKKSGLAQQFYIHGYDLSGDVGAINNCSSPRGTHEITGIDKSAIERVNGLADGSIEFNTWFNDAANQAHAALKDLPTGDRIILYAMGSAQGDVAAGLVAKQVNYDWQRPQDGSLQGTVQGQGSLGVGLEWMNLFTAGKRTDTSSGVTASKDDAAGTSNGLAAILQVFALLTASVTISLEDSPDNAVWTTRLTFTAVAPAGAPTAERKTVAGTVDRYLRVNLTGTFTSVTWALAYRRGTAQDDKAY